MMGVLLDEKDLQKLIVIGDRILIKPKVPQSKTKSGLYLHPGVNENEKVQIGYVLKVVQGYPIQAVSDIKKNILLFLSQLSFCFYVTMGCLNKHEHYGKKIT
jgi:hypothetical protein